MKQKTILPVILSIVVLALIGYGIFLVGKNSGAKNSNNSTGTNTQEQAQKISVAPVNEVDNIKGDKNAPVTLIEYSDYQCPYCVKHYPTMQDIIAKNQGKVKWVFRSFPLPFHKAAEKASEAAEAAGAQGKFWEYSDLLIKNSQSDGTGLAEADLIKYAEELNLNIDQFKSDLSSGRFASKVEKDTKSGEAAGVDGTPATFLIDKNGNTQVISGAVSESQIQSKIDAALNK